MAILPRLRPIEKVSRTLSGVPELFLCPILRDTGKKTQGYPIAELYRFDQAESERLTKLGFNFEIPSRIAAGAARPVASPSSNEAKLVTVEGEQPDDLLKPVFENGESYSRLVAG